MDFDLFILNAPDLSYSATLHLKSYAISDLIHIHVHSISQMSTIYGYSKFKLSKFNCNILALRPFRCTEGLAASFSALITLKEITKRRHKIVLSSTLNQLPNPNHGISPCNSFTTASVVVTLANSLKLSKCTAITVSASHSPPGFSHAAVASPTSTASPSTTRPSSPTRSVTCKFPAIRVVVLTQ